ncbi:MAG: hypothetical protein R3F61_17505 [Myxococcota bacterium]
MEDETQFRMVCPKCGSLSFTVRRDQRAYVHKSQPFELVFSCRCGKQLFGDQIQEEYDRQKAGWDGPPIVESEEDNEALERQHEEERRKEQLRRAMEYRRTYLQEKRRAQADAERSRKEEEDRRWREKVARVEAEERDQRATAAAAAANGGKAVKPKPRPKPRPPEPTLAPAHTPAYTPAARVEPAPAPVRAAPAPAPVHAAHAGAAAAPRAPEPEKPAPAPVLASSEEVDDEHPHAEFMPYLLSGHFAELFPDATPPDVKSPMLCVWPPCEKNRRKKSKYCSRECSNKNARWRHKMRKKDD